MKRNRTVPYKFKSNKLQYITITVLFLFSASPFFTKHVQLLTLSLLVFGSIYFNKTGKLNKEIVIVFFAITILNTANYFLFNFFSLKSFMGNYVRFLMPYFAIKLIGPRFPHYFVRLIKVFTIISLIFYIPGNFIPGFNTFLQNIPRILGTDSLENNHFIIYTVEFATPWESGIPVYRNSGPTGEPGEFVGYLLMAMIFEFIIHKKLWTKTNMLFAVTIITTFSTAGFVAFFVLLASYYFLFGKIWGKVIIFPIIIFVGYYTYYRYDFMYRKVDLQLEMITAAEDIEDIPRDGRLPNLVRNISDSFEYPLFGKGRNRATRYTNWEKMRADEFANNTGAFPVQFGWPFFIYYTFLLYAGFKTLLQKYKVNKKYAYIIVLIIYTLATSQGFLLFPLFVSLIYLKNIHPRKKVTIERYSYHTYAQSYTAIN